MAHNVRWGLDNPHYLLQMKAKQVDPLMAE